MLYEAYSAENQQESDGIKAAFISLYENMNDLPLQDVDRIIAPAYTIAQSHEKEGFIAGVRLGMRLSREQKIRN